MGKIKGIEREISMDHLENINLFNAYYEIKAIDRKIELLLTLRATADGIKPNRLKEILVDGGFRENDIILNAIIKKDKYTESLQALYKSKNAYEKYILDEIDRLKFVQPQMAIIYLREYEKLKWGDIAKKMNYSEKQVRRYYNKYKEDKYGRNKV